MKSSFPQTDFTDSGAGNQKGHFHSCVLMLAQEYVHEH